MTTETLKETSQDEARPLPSAEQRKWETEQVPRLQDYKDRTGYLSGPMRGMPEHNYPLFNAAAAEYRNEGFHLISPAENFGGRQDLDWSVYMKEDLDTILYSVEYLVVLPDWERSAGSLLEVAVAQAIGLPVFDAHTRCPVMFSQLVADGGYLAVSPAAQWLTMEANDDDEDDEEYEDEDDDADQNEDEDEGEFYQSDSERESYLDGYHLGFSEGLDKGLTMGKEIAESERAAMADLIQVQSQRITELKEARNSEIVANAEALQAAADMGYQSCLVNGRLEAEAQNQNRGAVPTGLLDEVLSLLDQAFYSLPEPCDEAVLDGYIDAGQLQENAVLCSRILDVIEELSEYTASREAEPERESQIKTGGGVLPPNQATPADARTTHREFADARYRVRAMPEMFVVLTELAVRSRRDPAIARILHALFDDWREHVVSLLTRGVAEGAFRPGLDVEAIARTIMAQLTAIGYQVLGPSGDVEVDRLVADLVAQTEHWLSG